MSDSAGSKRKNTDASPNPAKKSRQGDFKLNLNYALDKEHEAKSFKEILELPPHALQGLAPGADDLLKKQFGISNVKELAEFKYFKRARAIMVLADREEADARDAEAKFNINNMVDKDSEVKSLKEMVEASVETLQGIGPVKAEWLSKLRIKTVKDLGNWKFCKWAEAIVECAASELDVDQSIAK